MMPRENATNRTDVSSNEMHVYTRGHEIGGSVFRFDTRFYLDDDHRMADGDQPIAAVIAKNPGSIQVPRNGELVLHHVRSPHQGRLPRTVRGCFRKAFKQARITAPRGAYIQIWNLFYLCNPKLNEAIAAVKEIEHRSGQQVCTTESTVPPIVWFAWGRPEKKKLANHAERFLTLDIEHPFYFCMDKQKVVAKKPAINCGAKHTQGMKTQPIINHLAQILPTLSRW